MAVANDATAYLGSEGAFEVNERTANLSVMVRNNFDVDGLDVTGTVEDHSNTTTLGPGGSETFDYETVTCGAPISVEAEGDGVDVELERSVEC